MNLSKRFYIKNKLNFILASVSILFHGILFVLLAVVMQRILDIAATKDTSQIKGVIMMSSVFIALLGLAWLMDRHFRNRFLEKSLRQYKDYAFARIMQKNAASFSKEPAGRYISALSNDVNSIEANYLQSNFVILSSGVQFILAISVMLWYHVGLTLFALGVTVLTVAVSIMLGGRLAAEEKKVSLCNEGFISTVKDFLGGFFVVKSFKAEDEAAALLGERNSALERAKCHRRRTEAFINLAGTCMGIAAHLCIMIFGVYLTIQGQVTIGVLAAFIQLMNFVTQPVQAIPPALANRKAAKALIDKMGGSLSANADTPGKLRIDGDMIDISLRNVSFGYDRGENVLEDINITFCHGKS
jgi:ABC-type multidrug transport system fused ATPase/permease subunit